ncbi:mechanosensitive ion channel family protein [Comamonas flocculans]|uniref:Mechanosensitive ion channel family protein n=1 Tax=Comamonas flocculans TaxID=2597701 RepID=A0A5B8RVS0_9BURK|nr:mechanosensitive ion channel family protein [Comamonas flocculans]QEA13621.1 mechanosensitive ion channel family protein [Comamonas flocculans]
MDVQDWWKEPLWLGETALAWAVALGAALLAYMLVHALAVLLARRLEKLARQRPGSALTIAEAVVKATRGWLLLLLSLAVALRTLHLSRPLPDVLSQLIYVLVGVQLALWLSRLLVRSLEHLAHQDGAPRNPVMLGIIKWSTQLIVWVVLLLAVLSNAGVNVNAFIASLGIGGVAVALAAQSVLGDLLASISIGLDKPFEVGEYIEFDKVSGTVSHVGIKSTRIASLSGEELAISNAQILGKLVHNYSRMQERRVAYALSIAVDTPREKAEAIVQEVRALIASIEGVRFDRGHLIGFGDAALNYEFIYYVLSPQFVQHRDVQQHITLGILALLEGLQVRLVTPTRVLHAPEEAH